MLCPSRSRTSAAWLQSSSLPPQETADSVEQTAIFIIFASSVGLDAEPNGCRYAIEYLNCLFAFENHKCALRHVDRKSILVARLSRLALGARRMRGTRLLIAVEAAA